MAMRERVARYCEMYLAASRGQEDPYRSPIRPTLVIHETFSLSERAELAVLGLQKENEVQLPAEVKWCEVGIYFLGKSCGPAPLDSLVVLIPAPALASYS
ncbi:unnamed protein product, partial [Mesorhabditis spiculigera]